MRQRRQRLQVSTFPFLAVLLCAMGSLILLLLVMDRRAKVVARAKAMRTMEQALAQARADEEKAAAAHRAEWERRRQLLHHQLQQQDSQVLRELEGIHSQLVAAAGSVQTEVAHSRQLHEQLEAEQSGLARSEAELSAQRAELASASQQTDASRTELARLTADLERMERCLADLKAARQRQQQMVSLVPYHGKRGDNRRPIYIECNGDDLVFHPDHLVLHGLMLSPTAVREEIERRLGQQRSETKAVNVKPEDNAYLLMLVRPNGITTYYRTLSALKGLPVDFGYEFIDQDWILDFSEDDNRAKTQPWMAADRTKEAPALSPSSKVAASGPAPSGRFQGRSQGVASGGTVGGPAMGIRAFAGGIGSPGLRSGGTSSGPEGILVPAPPGNAAGVPPAANLHNAGTPRLGTSAASVPSLADVLAGSGRSPAGRATSWNGQSIPASPSSLGQGEPSRLTGSSAEGMQTSPAVAEGRPATTTQSAESRVARGNGTAESQLEGGATGSSKPDLSVNDLRMGAPPSLLAPVPLNGKAAGNSAAGASQEPASESVGSVPSTHERPGSAERAPGPASDVLDRLAVPNRSQKSVRAGPARPGPLVGNRDWTIAIECTADALVVVSSGQRITTAELSMGKNDANPLLEIVQRLIARRQATVRPGEPPYRPMIRFRVHPDGLRAYHLAYPALEALHVPMSRENVDPEEIKAVRP